MNSIKHLGLMGFLLSFLAPCLMAERPLRILYFQAKSDAPEKASLYVGGKPLQETELPRHNFTKNIEIPDGDVVLSFLPQALPSDAALPKGATYCETSRKLE